MTISHFRKEFKPHPTKVSTEKMALLRPPATPGRAAGSAKHHGAGLLASVNSLWHRVTKKLQGNGGGARTSGGCSPKSPLAKPKQLLATISLLRRKKATNDGVLDGEDFGDGGLWQRSILMGDKCQPPDFSGVIYYDSNGNRMSEMPMKSPRASPLPAYLHCPSPKP
nr:Actin cytoskeleton-regulatory complex protein [Ipomoea batatas]